VKHLGARRQKLAPQLAGIGIDPDRAFGGVRQGQRRASLDTDLQIGAWPR
jgi:hypothetical protein